MVQIKQKTKMTPEQFCYWLQGYFELSSEERPQLYSEQTRIVRDHLALVFKKETPEITFAWQEFKGEDRTPEIPKAISKDMQYFC